MAEERVRWGILSAAKIAREWVVPAIHMSDRGELAAVASLTPGKAAGLASPYGPVTLHETYEGLLADPDVDAIYIPLPNGAHVEWTAKCLEAGKHVLCEKPIALRAEEIDRLIALRDRTGLVAAEAFMVTHHPQWIRARTLVQDGAIGRLRQVQGAFSFYNTDPDNIRNRADLAGGALRDIGVYPAIGARFVTGAEPVSVPWAEIEWDNGIDATARAIAVFPDFGMDSTSRCAWRRASSWSSTARRAGWRCTRRSTQAATATRCWNSAPPRPRSCWSASRARTSTAPRSTPSTTASSTARPTPARSRCRAATRR